jgi:hypothetical protein
VRHDRSLNARNKLLIIIAESHLTFDIFMRHPANAGINEFEACEAIAMLVGTPGLAWRDGGAIGVAETQTIGLSHTMVRDAIAHITGAVNFLSTTLEKRRVELYNEFKTQFAKDGKWEMAPFFRIPNPSNVSKQRPK